MPAPWCDEVDDILKEVEEENKVLQIGNFVEELGPEFEQFVVKAGENYKKKMAEQINSKGKKLEELGYKKYLENK